MAMPTSAAPTAAWIAGQVTDAFPWDEAPSHLIRDRDKAFSPAYIHRIRAMGIRDHPTAPRSPWQNGHVERLIGSIRRESLDHLVVFDKAQLRRVLRNYAFYYNQGPDSPLIGQECAGFSAPAEARPHRSHLNSRWAASTICQV
jgi:transposase InsO family protein